ncbi:MAG TPA: hypothetical protein VFQ18_00445, partial [Candidatus Acidoferrum sp.]|nr:hypothetical protein [Candidatus Acidoferrum sp.]
MDSGLPTEGEITNNPLKIVRDAVAAFDPVDLLATAAALQMSRKTRIGARGFSASLRVKAVQTHDRHTVPSHREGHFIEVVSVHGTSKIPLYLPFPPLGRRVECYVERYPFAIWVIGVEYSRGSPLHSLYYEFCTTVAYWLWQMTPSLEPILSR